MLARKPGQSLRQELTKPGMKLKWVLTTALKQRLRELTKLGRNLPMELSARKIASFWRNKAGGLLQKGPIVGKFQARDGRKTFLESNNKIRHVSISHFSYWLCKESGPRPAGSVRPEF